MLKVIYVARINKTAEVLASIAKRSVVSQSDLTNSRELLNLFAGSKANPKRRIIDTTALLTKQGFVSVGEIDREVIYKITNRGEDHLKNYQVTKRTYISPKESWDGKWYMTCYEIAEPQKAVRNGIILTLKRQGMVNYTKGLWIYPYDPSSLLEGLRTRYNLTKSQLWTFTSIDLPNEQTFLDKFELNKNTV